MAQAFQDCYMHASSYYVKMTLAQNSILTIYWTQPAEPDFPIEKSSRKLNYMTLCLSKEVTNPVLCISEQIKFEDFLFSVD